MPALQDNQKIRLYLSIHNATKAFGSLTAVDQVSLDVSKGEFVCILGPSGCGKTTLLRIIAGLEEQDEGRIYLDGEEITGFLPSKRNFGIVFQSYALFPNLTAAQNIAYGLKSKGRSKKEIACRVQALLDLVGLEECGNKYPAQLSGGQQQRVALSRALAPSPSVLLLDEPLSALDAKVREKLRHEIKNLQKRLEVTTVMVTHDQVEALTMADRIVIMDHGRIVQSGAPQTVYSRPTNPFVADFVGSMNLFRGVSALDQHLFQFGNLEFTAPSDPFPPGSQVTLAIRPEDIELVNEERGGGNVLTAKVEGLEFRGPFCRVQLILPGERNGSPKTSVHADISMEKLRRLGIQRDMDIQIQLPSDRLLVFGDMAS